MLKKRKKYAVSESSINYTALSIGFIMLIVIGFAIYIIVNQKNTQAAVNNPNYSAQSSDIQQSQIQTQTSDDSSDDSQDSNDASVLNPDSQYSSYYAASTADTIEFGPEIVSANAILIDMQSMRIIAQKNPEDKIYPASLTKILTAITAIEMPSYLQDFSSDENSDDEAADNLDDASMPDSSSFDQSITAEAADNLEDTFILDTSFFNQLIAEDASMAGFQPGEPMKIIDMLYGTMLPSGADATLGLAQYFCGSEYAFADAMNDKLKEIGIKDSSHFTNCSGLHDDNHYTTVEDIAAILNYSLQNPLFEQIITAHSYTSSATDIHPEGILMESTLFSKITGDEVPGVTILGGKTGYTSQAGDCLASFAEKDGKRYMLVTANADPSGDIVNPHIADAITIYGNYLN